MATALALEILGVGESLYVPTQTVRLLLVSLPHAILTLGSDPASFAEGTAACVGTGCVPTGNEVAIGGPNSVGAGGGVYGTSVSVTDGNGPASVPIGDGIDGIDGIDEVAVKVLDTVVAVPTVGCTCELLPFWTSVLGELLQPENTTKSKHKPQIIAVTLAAFINDLLPITALYMTYMQP